MKTFSQTTRGNLNSELKKRLEEVIIQRECENTGLDRLAKTFNRLMSDPAIPKTVPKQGRPPLSLEDKLKNKLERERKLLHQEQLF